MDTRFPAPHKRFFGILGAMLLVFAMWAPAASPAVANVGLRDQIAKLHVASEHQRGYQRSRFPHWDELSNGCSVREEVLRTESRTPPSVDPRTCKVSNGLWFSVYDGVSLRDPSVVDIDHVVPLKEAWDSGAWKWAPTTLRAYANDLKDPRSLIAVSSRSNRAKSDRDPAQWLPIAAARCEYVANWVAVKARWSLSVDPAEKAALLRVADSCADTPQYAPTPTPTTPKPTPPFFYATCAAARAAGAATLRIGTPGYRVELDRDRDGIACE